MKDVHTEHCCAVHGCKYDTKECTVVTKKAVQSYPCEDCETTDFGIRSEARVRPDGTVDTRLWIPCSMMEVMSIMEMHERIADHHSVESIISSHGKRLREILNAFEETWPK